MEEKAKLRVEIDGQDAKTSLQELQTEAKDINKELRRMKEAGEEGSEGWQDLKVRQREVNAEMLEFTRHLDVNDASMNQLNARSRLLNRELKDLKVGSEEWLEKLSQVREVDDKIDEVKKSVRGLGDEVEKQPSMWEGMKGSILAVFTGTGLLELAKTAATAIFDFGKEVFDTTAKFEGYESVLKIALGTQEEATQAMANIKEMARTTPFTVDELTGSYVKLVNRGFDPTMDSMTKLSDVAASQGKSFDQLAEAILDATTGEMERLKDIGITATKSNGEVELSFRGVHKTVKETPEAIQEAIIAFGELEGVQGAGAAASLTMAGRLGNIHDAMTEVMVMIGNGLKPVFNGLLDAMAAGIDVVKGLFSGSSELTPVFKSIWDVVSNLWGTFKSYFGTLLSGAKDSGLLKGVMDQLVGTLKIVATAFMLALTGTQAFFDALNALINKGKQVANFFGAEFKIDPKANFDTLQKNADKNFKSIENLWKGTQDKGVKSHADATDTITKTHEKGQQAQTLAEKKEAEKRAKAREDQAKKDEKEAEKTRATEEKAEADLLKKIDDMRVKAITDDKTRKIAEITLHYEREKKSIEDSKGLTADKTTAITMLHTQMETNIAKTEEEFRKKKETEEEALRKKTEAAEKTLRDNRLKESKAMFDAEFQAATAKAQNELDMTSTNSKAMWEAKKNLLDVEWAYKKQQMANEAAAEKAKIAESISDTDKQRIAMEQIDAKLKDKLSSEEKKFQKDKTKLNEDENKARDTNNKEFFDALKKAGEGDVKSTLEFLKKKAEEDQKHNKDRKEDRVKLKDAIAGLMKGDTELFTKYMAQKVQTDKDGNATQLQQFSDKTQKVADVATAAIGALKQMNQQYLEWEVGRIKKEEQEQLDSWKREYEGGKISKEEFEKGNVRITQESKAKELAARKDAFEREKKMNMAAAAINTAQAALKSFAMFGWPIGLIMAALAAVAGGIQIAAISRQQFSGRDGGVVNSAGKIFAQSGAVIPRNAFVAQGDAHAATYGYGGISMINRRTGMEVGEIEGGEPVMVLSKNTYANNGKLIDSLLHSSLYQNGAPISMARGGVLTAAGARMWGDGGVVDTGVNVDGMMDENKKSQATMNETRDNTGKTVEGIANLSRVMQKSQQQGGVNIAYIADAIMRELQHMGRIMQGIERVGMVTNTDLSKILNNTISQNKSNHQSLNDVIKSGLNAIQELLLKNQNADNQKIDNISNAIMTLLRNNSNSLIQTLRNEGVDSRDTMVGIHRADYYQSESLAFQLMTLLRNNHTAGTQTLQREMRQNRELSVDIFDENNKNIQRLSNESARVAERYHQEDARQRSAISTQHLRQNSANEASRHQDAMGEMMLQRMIQQELNWHGALLNDIKHKPDGSGNILHAIGRLEANAAKSNLK
jgi:hypothetical protein